MSDKNVEIYYCEFREQQQVLSRHHIGKFSICRIIAVKSIDEIASILPKEVIEQLLEDREVEIFDKNIINKIASLEAKEGDYLRLVFRNI